MPHIRIIPRYLVDSKVSATLKSHCYEYPLKLFQMGSSPWCKIFPSILYSHQMVSSSYQLNELLKPQLEFKLALLMKKAKTTMKRPAQSLTINILWIQRNNKAPWTSSTVTCYRHTKLEQEPPPDFEEHQELSSPLGRHQYQQDPSNSILSI